MKIGRLSINLAEKPTAVPRATEETALAERAYGMLTTLVDLPDDRPMHRLTIEQSDEMERRDDMVRAALALKRTARLATGFDIQPASRRADHVKQAEFCRYVFRHMSGTVHQTLNEMMLAFHRGFSVHELVWGEPYANGSFAGKVGFARIKQKNPERLYFRSDDFGNLIPEGIWQQRDPTGKHDLERSELYRHLKVKDFLIYVHDKRDDNWYGESDLRAAWRPYLLKNDVFPAWKDFMVRFGAPLLIAYLKGDVTPQQRAKVQQLVEKLRRGTAAVLPSGMTVEDLVAKLAQTHTSTYEEAIRTCDRAIGRSVLMPSLVLGEGERSGSFALGKSHVETFLSVLDFEGIVISDAFNEQPIRRLIDQNFPGADDYPTLVFKPFSQEDMKPIAEVVKILAEAGYPPSPEWVNERLGIPVEEARREPPPDEDTGDDDEDPEDPVDTDPENDDEDAPVKARSRQARSSRVSFAGAAGRYWRRPFDHEEKVDFAALETIEAADLQAASASIVGIIAAANEEVVARLGKACPPHRTESRGSDSPPLSSATSGRSLNGST